jgi:hypothetical protein
VSVITLDRGRSIGVGAIMLILMYLVTVVAGLEPSLENLRYLSAFNYYHPGAIIDQGQSPAGETALFLAAAIGCWAIAVWRFRTRDLVA